MNLSELLSDLNEASARLQIAYGYARAAWRRLEDQQPGLPSGHPAAGDPDPDGEKSEESFVSWDEQQRDLRVLKDATARLFKDSTTVYDITTRWGLPSHERAHITQPGEMWCTSCWRDDRYCEPVAKGRYKGLCRWCGDFLGAHKRRPPLAVLQARHRGQRITEEMVHRELRKKAS